MSKKYILAMPPITVAARENPICFSESGDQDKIRCIYEISRAHQKFQVDTQCFIG